MNCQIKLSACVELFTSPTCLQTLSPSFSHAPFSYSDIIIEREILMQKYIHLVQIMETEKVAANQLRTQLEDQDTEIERLKAEVCMSAPTSACACIHKSTYCRAHMHVAQMHVAQMRSQMEHDGKTLEFRTHESLKLKHSRAPVSPRALLPHHAAT